MWSGPVNCPDRLLTGRKIRNFVYDIFPFHKMIRVGALVAVNHSRTPPAYWLILALRDAMPRRVPLACGRVRSSVRPVDGAGQTLLGCMESPC